METNLNHFETALPILVDNVRDEMQGQGMITTIRTSSTEAANSSDASRGDAMFSIAVADDRNGIAPDISSACSMLFYTTQWAGKRTRLGLVRIRAALKQRSQHSM